VVSFSAVENNLKIVGVIFSIFQVSESSILRNLQMMQKFLGYKVNNQIISSKAAHFDAKILNLVFFSKSSKFFV